MPRYCTECGTEREATDRYCTHCGAAFQDQRLLPAADTAPLSNFEPLHRLATLMTDQQAWLRRNTLLAPLQEIIDGIQLRTAMTTATEAQVAQILAGYQSYTQEQIELVIDHVRQARRLRDAEVALEVKRRSLELDDAVKEREHRRQMERLREEHKHERDIVELRAQLELVNAIIHSFNQLRMIRLEAEAEGQADVQQLKMLSQIIRQSFTALAEIDASQIAYAERIKELDFDNLDEAPSFELVEQLMEAAIDRITKGVTQFGESARAGRRTRRRPQEAE